MSPNAERSITTMLDELAAESATGRAGTFAELVERAYADLHGLARACLVREGRAPDGRTLGATAVVHDAVVELMRQREQPKSSEHFFGLASFLMVRMIRANLRDAKAAKRGGGRRGAGLGDAPEPAGPAHDPGDAGESATRVARALDRFRDEHPIQAEAFTLGSVCGLPVARVCELMRISESTYHRHARFARAWLGAELKGVNDGR